MAPRNPHHIDQAIVVAFFIAMLAAGLILAGHARGDTVTVPGAKGYTIRLPEKWEPACYKNFYPENGMGPEDFCSGDVLFEAAPPSCAEVAWCKLHGLADEEDLGECGDFDPVSSCSGKPNYKRKLPRCGSGKSKRPCKEGM